MKIPFDKKITAVALIVFVAAFSGYVSGTRNGIVKDDNVPEKAEVREALDVVQNETNVKAEEQVAPKKYVLRETDGKIALILSEPDGEENVYKTYDINVKTLPEADRIKLAEGIETESLSDALLMVEDYL